MARAQPDERAEHQDAAPHTVGEVARLAGVCVRTLRHHDAIGLLVPPRGGGNGYRRYGPADLRRLQRILAYRALGFDLDAIRRMLDDPGEDELSHLRRQRTLLQARRRRIEAMLNALDVTMEARQMGIELDPEDMLEVFGEHDPEALRRPRRRAGGVRGGRHPRQRRAGRRRTRTGARRTRGEPRRRAMIERTGKAETRPAGDPREGT